MRLLPRRAFLAGSFALLALALLAGGALLGPEFSGSTSSEYAFFSLSPSGQEGGWAVPASCPSDLHDEPNYGQPCSVCNSCGVCNSGFIQCGGSCSAAAPPSCVGETAGACGDGVTDAYWIGAAMNCAAAEPVFASCPVGTRVFTQTSTTTKSCAPLNSFSYTGYESRCVADPSCVAPPLLPSVNLTVNGLDSVPGITAGSPLTLAWTTANAGPGATCTATGFGWAGPKAWDGGPDTVTAGVTSTYAFACSQAGVAFSDSVSVTVTCAASCTNWSACSGPCTAGQGTQSRTCVRTDCSSGVETRSCTTVFCRDSSWREVGQ